MVWIRRFAAVALALAALMATGYAPAGAAVMWHPKPALLPTPWTKLVGPDNALPDYPRPQMARTSWLNLNGVWGYLGRSAGPVLPAPPPPASRTASRSWSRTRRSRRCPASLATTTRCGTARSFKVPSGWQGQHVLLHFGAVDQIATVWVNNQQVAHHEGGYTEFSADITRGAAAGRARRRSPCGCRTATKPTRSRSASSATSPGGLFYTGASGIWQTVWMEPVRAAHIDKLDITPDLTRPDGHPEGFGDERRARGGVRRRARVVESWRSRPALPGGRSASRCPNRICGLPTTRTSTT